MRLIDASPLQEIVDGAIDKVTYFADKERCRLFLRLIVEQPTIDAVPVVRCKECKYENKCNKHISTWEIGDDMEHYWADRPVEFCGYGERRENV